MRRLSAAILRASLMLYSVTAFAQSQGNLPAFDVISRDRQVSLLVPKGTSETQLRDLIVAISCAHQKKTLQDLGIPPQTPGGIHGPYFGISIEVFDDLAKLKRWQTFDSEKSSEATYQRYESDIKARISTTDFATKKGIAQASIGPGDSATSKSVALPPLATCPAIRLAAANSRPKQTDLRIYGLRPGDSLSKAKSLVGDCKVIYEGLCQLKDGEIAGIRAQRHIELDHGHITKILLSFDESRAMTVYAMLRQQHGEPTAGASSKVCPNRPGCTGWEQNGLLLGFSPTGGVSLRAATP